MKAWPQRRRRETAILVQQVQRVLGESKKLLEQREMQLRQQEQFVEQRATIADKMMGNHRWQSPRRQMELGLVSSLWIFRTRTMWIVGAHRVDGKCFVLRAESR
jgi:hypothetical protein